MSRSAAHMHSFVGGIGVASVVAIVGGAAAVGLGVFCGVAGATALGVPFFLGGLCAKLGHRVMHWMSGDAPEGEHLRLGTFALGAGLAAYGLFATCAPTHHAEANRHRIFSEAKSLSHKFEHAAREVNKHIIWPNIEPAHQSRPQP